MSAPIVLGIETSCDETGVGIVRGRDVLANVIASSMDEQARYGGVVPEIAARAHLEAIGPALRQALDTAGVRLADLDAIAVTAGPGLAGALMVGVGAALVAVLRLPLSAVLLAVALSGGAGKGVEPLVIVGVAVALITTLALSRNNSSPQEV